MINALSCIATEKVAHYINDGIYRNLKYKLDSKSSDQVYSKLLKISRGLIHEYNHEIGQRLELRNVDYGKFKIDRNTVMVLKKHCLESLGIGDLDYIGYYYRDLIDDNTIDIFELLKAILNNETRRNLHYLDIKGSHAFSKKWTKNIGTILPVLRSLIICGRHLQSDDFQQLCESIPNLTYLDISETNVPNISGISSLKNLESLIMRSVELECFEQFVDLFNLTGLRILDVSRSMYKHDTKIINQYVQSNKVLKELRFLECSGTDINKNLLEQILNSHDNLQQVAAINCHIRSLSLHHEVFLLNTATLTSSLKSLTHYLGVHRISSVERVLENMLHLFPKYDPDLDNRFDFSECVKIIINSALKIESSLGIQGYGTLCLWHIARNQDARFQPFDLYQLVCKLLDGVYNNGRLFIATKDFNISLWRTIESLLKLLESSLKPMSYERVCRIAGLCISRNEVDDEMKTRAIPIFATYIKRISSQSVYYIDFNHKLMPKIILHLKKSIELRKTYWITFCLDILTQITQNSADACEKLAECEEMNVLLECFGNLTKASDHLKILKILKNVLLELTDKNVKHVAIDARISVLQERLDEWDDERAYYVFTVLALIISNFPTIVNREPANSLIRECFPEISNVIKIPVSDSKIYVKNGILKKILKDSREDGSLLWALLVIKSSMEQDKSFVNLLTTEMSNLNTNSEIIMNMKAEIKNLI